MLKPAYDKDGITLYQGDCTEILPRLIDEYGEGLVDLVVTDPPYGINYVSNYRNKEELLGKAIHNDSDLNIVAKAAPFIERILGENKAAYVFVHPNMIGENRLILDQYLNYKNTLVWDKGDGGTFGDLGAGYSLTWEAVLYYNKGRRLLNGMRPRTIVRGLFAESESKPLNEIPQSELLSLIQFLIYKGDLTEEEISMIPEYLREHIFKKYSKDRIRVEWSARNDPVHPTVKPQRLLQKFVEASSDENDIVLDCFMGSGTTAAACKKTGRRFIGIELSPAFMNVAIARLETLNLD